MYMLAPVAGHRFTGREEVYVLDIHRLGAGLASITSDQQLSLFDPARLGAGPITSLPTAHGNIKALRPFDRASEVYTLTHDEKLAVFNLDAGYEKGTPVADFGDVRAELACQYVANVTAKVDGSGAIIGVGSQDRQNFQLVHLARGSEKNSWVFDRASSVGLPGGHGEEIVRAFCFYDDEQVVFTAGEDGYIKAWRPN
ncbi:hypothetical protein VdG1_03184 [Verticillium dahliae VDG1]|nr:hypothetical protein VdG1_03184 [Verticillium dahliae VDG1]